MREPKSYLIEIAGQMPDAIYERALQEVVRCRDCKHFNEYHGKCHRQSGVLIDDYSTRRLEDLVDVLVLADAEPDGFCSLGERKENHAD